MLGLRSRKSSHIPPVKSRAPFQYGLGRIRGIAPGVNLIENGEGDGSAPSRNTPSKWYDSPCQLPLIASERGVGSAPSGSAIVFAS